jgi:hypothetical protein
LNTLKKCGIKYVLNVTKECPMFHPNEFVYKRVDLYDVATSNLFPHFPEICDFIKEGREAGGVYVHCAYGISRSSTSVMAYLMKEQGMTYPEARQYCERRRSIVYPNSGFVRQLKRWEKVINTMKIGTGDRGDLFGRTNSNNLKLGNMDRYRVGDNNMDLVIKGKKNGSVYNNNFMNGPVAKRKMAGLREPRLPNKIDHQDEMTDTMQDYFGKIIDEFDKEESGPAMWGTKLDSGSERMDRLSDFQDLANRTSKKWASHGAASGFTGNVITKKPNYQIKLNPNHKFEK